MENPKCRILIVDDNDTVRNVVSDHFKGLGYSVIEARDGIQGLEVALKDLADLIILDVMMPGMDGLEVLRQVRLDPRTATTPVVIFTAVSDPVLERHALEKGANDYLVKGRFNFSELSDRLSRYLADA